MTTPTGKRLERLVAAIHYAESTGAAVVWNEVIEGRQFDVTVRFKYGLHTYLTVIECKEYSSKVSVEKIDALVTKARDAKANKAIMISTRGFQSGCFSVAERHDVQLLVLTESSQTPVPDLVARITPGINVFSVRFGRAGSHAEVELEDWGGRLAYLMNHAKVVLPLGTKTPIQLVNEWELTRPNIELGRENEVEFPLPLGTELHVPHEEPATVSSMRFTCSLIDVAIPKQPLPDNHILVGMATRVELRDPKGNLHHSTPLNEIPLGFDAPVVPGRFYELPEMFNRYYCEKIDGDLVTWTLLESYQHGLLVQANITQKVKYQNHYIEVTDEVVLHRLHAMLARFKAKK